MSFEQPVLWLGMAGFSPEQHAQLTSLLGRLSKGWPAWQMGAFAEADAWLVSGEKSRLLGADTLKILAGLPTERALQLNLAEVDRPIAFSQPMTAGDLDPAHTFDPSSGVSLRKVLQQFENWLRPLRSQFVLGGQLVERESELLPGIYHVSHKGNLLAVMDFHAWRIGISPQADPVEFELARWDKRPSGAHDIPGHFLHSSLTQLRWIYVQRTERDVLPPRYRSRPIYFRHAPGVPLRWLRDSQLVLLRELSVEAGDFDDMLQRTGLAPVQLARDLATLYFAGSVTTTAEKAGNTGFAGLEENLSGKIVGTAAEAAPMDSAAVLAPRRPSARRSDLTAPVQLGLK
ncbi:hypothetical protein [Polaromonas sp. SM01]|uniref:hypothetical protein n=1 Tax=Polaromonas sp. SM01 TaxID=3085630 RepID=UPI0029816093|nr:hypothetical protein [Polaromonas sp. SM01]MDW5445047.1 hypothetical protein [Polaromonas sp. SM01]